MSSHPTALITGASSGIGFELARLFASDGYSLVLVAREPKQLTRAADSLRKEFRVTVLAIPVDLSSPDAAGKLFSQLSRKRISVDALVNSAGFGAYGDFWEIPWERQEAMMQVNMLTLAHLTHLLLPAMLSRKHGRILNLASTAAFQPGPRMAAYYASKAFVLSFSQALSSELRGTGVTVTALCPGPTRTQFGKRSGVDRARVFRGELMDARTVAQAGYRGMLAGKRDVIPGLRNRILAYCARIFPTSLVLRIVERLHHESG